MFFFILFFILRKRYFALHQRAGGTNGILLQLLQVLVLCLFLCFTTCSIKGKTTCLVFKFIPGPSFLGRICKIMSCVQVHLMYIGHQYRHIAVYPPMLATTILYHILRELSCVDFGSTNGIESVKFI